MKVAANIFWIIGLFFIAAATLYGFWVEWTEWAGIPAIYAVGGMSWMIAWYLRAAEHKYGVGPADDEDGQIVEYAGTYGTFAPWSWWPLGLGLGCAIIVTGLAVVVPPDAEPRRFRAGNGSLPERFRPGNGSLARPLWMGSEYRAARIRRGRGRAPRRPTTTARGSGRWRGRGPGADLDHTVLPVWIGRRRRVGTSGWPARADAASAWNGG